MTPADGPPGRLRRLVRRAARSTIAHNAAALYAVQIAGYVVPLATLPYLTRVLGADDWGRVVFFQSFAIWLSLILQYGFAFSATRRVAHARGRPAPLSRVVNETQGARFFLLAVVLAIGVVAAAAVRPLREAPAYLASALFLAVTQGFSPLWYFQGVERLRAPAALDVAAKFASAVGVFVLVSHPDDGWRVLALQAAAAFVSTGVTTLWMHREVPFRLAAPRRVLATLRGGFTMFVFVGAASVYTTANSFILGLLAAPAAVGYFGSAEKLIRAASGLLGPISQALYPRVNHLMKHDPARAVLLVRKSLIPVSAFGLAIGVAIAVAAPLLTRVLFGPGYEPAVPVLRILAAIPPILAVGTVLGIQWALPLGLDRPYTLLVLLAGGVNLAMAVALVPRFGASGMATAAVVAEGFVECGLIWLVLRAGGRLRARATRASEPL